VIPMRRILLFRSGRGDCRQPCFSEPAPTSATPQNQECQSHLRPSCEVHIAFVLGRQVDENQFDSVLQSAADQPADITSDGIDDPADKSDADSSDEPRGMNSRDHLDPVEYAIHSDHSGSQSDTLDPVDEPNSVDEQVCTQDDDNVSNPGPDNDNHSTQDVQGYDDHADNDVHSDGGAYQEVDYGTDGGYNNGGGYDYGDDGGGYEDDGGGCDFYQDDYY